MNKRILTVLAASIAFSSGGLARAADTVAIAGIVFQQDMFMRSVARGMSEEAKAENVTLLDGNSDNKAEKEASLIDTYISRGVKAIVIAPLSDQASIPALKRAHDKGIQVVTWTTDIKADFPAARVGSSGAIMGGGTGKAAARFIKEKLGGNATVGLIGFKAQLPELSTARTQGFLTEARKGSTLKIAAEQDAWLAEKAVTVVSDMLTANPNINVIYAANEGGTVGAVQAVRRMNKQGKVFVFGTDGSEQLTKFLQDNDDVLIATTAAQPKLIGREAVKAALKAVKGQPVDKVVEVPAVPLSRDDPKTLAAYASSLKNVN
ncbi:MULTISPECIES: substrate-binding domain-containing protein [unclassified Caballeronia]|uniref:substrate-binding domain-containing protein n=1 Tax=unclassified Caballeronia TaxID=2646786 RepID=UPI0020288803|nr:MULTISPECIES: substrate-binding domain-containing protein [unclassified Caballeronia]MDR5769866.1 substrate-binding domain-containing protein [Caballeronia sp. LZ028]